MIRYRDNDWGDVRVREAREVALFLRENFRNRARSWGLPEWRIEQIIQETEGTRTAGQPPS
jgi:hypothetical protein